MRLIDPGVDPDCTHSHCTQKADISGCKWVFLARVNGVYVCHIPGNDLH